MGRIKVLQANREKSKKPPLDVNMWYAPRPWISVGPSTSTGTCIKADTNSNKVTFLVTPSTSAGASLTTANGEKDIVHPYGSEPRKTNGGDIEEPLLDYEDYIKEEDNEDNEHGKKRSSKKKKRKRSSKSKGRNIAGVSIADCIRKYIARMRAFASWRKPRDARGTSKQHVLASRAKNKDRLLYRRRCLAVAENVAESHNSAKIAVGEPDPKIFNLIWRFQYLKIVEAISPEPWRLPVNRKRVAPSIDRVQHYNTPETKRRKVLND